MTLTPTYRYRGTLVRVIDGDTFEVDLDLGLYTWIRRQSLRLLDVFAPERHTPDGAILRAHLIEAIPVGTALIVETEKHRDLQDMRSFTRWVANVWLAENGVHLNPMIQALVVDPE